MTAGNASAQTPAEELYAALVVAAGLEGDDALPEATPFNDGVSNIQKYAFNMDLSGPDAQTMEPGGVSGLPNMKLHQDDGAAFWRVEFISRKEGGLIYKAWKSIRLAGDDFVPMTGSLTRTEIDDQWERVMIDEPIILESAPRLFFVIEVKHALADSSALDGFALIPAGNFEMGDATGVGWTDELPVRTVYVSEFHMAKYEVTQGLWDEVRAWGLANGYADLPAGDGKAANHPVHSINWYAMVKWCNARSEKEGLTPCYTVSGLTYKNGTRVEVVCDWTANGYRLPTEAEWEKAARGGLSGQNFPWGNTISHSQANYNSSSTYAYDVSPTRGHHPSYEVGDIPYSSPVGSFAPNGYGLYDMAGNVREWCWDWYGSYDSAPLTDPRGPASGSIRMSRGGGWHSVALNCRVSLRIKTGPDHGNPGAGFRLARSSAP